MLRAICIAILVALSSGCGGSIPTASVHGQVTVADKPVGPGKVILEPTGPATDPPLPITKLKFGPDGQFSGEAPVGKHQVIIQSDDVANEEAKQTGPPMVPLHYGQAANNEPVEIKSGDNKLDFQLKAKP
jgi:hypothetical protein